MPGFLMSPISPSRSIENNHDIYRGKDCMKTFCEPLWENAINIINFKKESNENVKICYICKGKLKINIWKIKIS